MKVEEYLKAHRAWLDGGCIGQAPECHANLRNADLCYVDLSSADLRGANLIDTDLCVANLRGAYLCFADLRNADLRYSDLRGAYLRYANLHGANLCYANLRGAYLPVGYRRTSVGRWSGLLRRPESRLDVGCRSHTFKEWRKNLDNIAKMYDATQKEVNAVRKILDEVSGI